MHRLIAWFVDNPVAANLLMLILVCSGLMALPQIHKEEFPNIETQYITVRVPYLGAAPAEVESGVCLRIEEAVNGIDGIKKVTTSAAEGMCGVWIQLHPDANKSKALDDITAQVNSISTFPANTERPVISELTVMSMIFQLAIAGDTDERSLKELTEEIRLELTELPGVSQVKPVYMRDYEISIEVSEHTLRQHNLTLKQIADAIRDSSIDIPGGAIKTSGGEIMLRTRGQMYTGREFENITVIARDDGTRVTLGDIATVIDGFEDSDVSARLDGERALLLEVSRVGNEDTLSIADEVYAFVDRKRQELPPGIRIEYWRNESDDLVARLDALLNNALGGLALVLLTLSLFLRTRLALWVAAGIPIAVLGALSLFPVVGLSISTLTLMGFLLALGVLVDDAIVVGERVYAHELKSGDMRMAAVNGTSEVSIPVFFGVLTTMAAFIPIVSISGDMGSLFQAVGATVVLCLIFSLIESQLVLPSHLAHRKVRKGQDGESRWERLQDRLSGWLEDFAQNRYQPFLAKVVRWRYVALSLGLAAMIVVAGMIASERIVFQFFPAVQGDELYAKLTMPEGTPLAVTERASQQIEAAAERVRARLDQDMPEGESAFIQMLTSVGLPVARGALPSFGGGGSHFAEVAISLVPHTERGGLTPSEAVALWREYTGLIPDALELSFTADAFKMGEDIDIQLRGRDVNQLGAAAADLREALLQLDGVYDLGDSFRVGKQELVLQIRPEAEMLGLTQADLGRQVRQAFYGQEAQRVQRGREDVRVMVRYPAQERVTLGDFENMRIRLNDGTEVPVLSVANVGLGRGYSTISRIDGQRIVSVLGSVDRQSATPEAILATVGETVFPVLEEKYPGIGFALSGEAEERAEAMGGLVRMSALALMVIFGLLAIPLKSYLQPLVIMSSIPFGMIGAIVGHYLMGTPLVFFSLLGIVALSGVVVNASLVLVDYINRRRREGVPLLQAVLDSGVVRFRPIMLTSLTTFVGLIPLMATADINTGMFVPMAISLGYGVLFATVVTLVLIPALYVVLEDFLALNARIGTTDVQTESADEQVALLDEVAARR